MVKQTNTPMDMRLVLAHTKTIKDFLQKEIPELFK